MMETAWRAAGAAGTRLPSLARRLTAGAAALALLGGPALADEASSVQVAQASDERTFDIPAGNLEAALLAFSRAAGLQLFYAADLTAGLSTEGARGRYTVEAALAQLLDGTGLRYAFSADDAVTLARADGAGGIILDPLTVEGAAAETARFGDAPAEVPGFAAEYQTTATKTPLSLQETPQAISVTTQQSIVARQARDVSSALELTAGVGRAAGGNGGPFSGRSLGGDDRFMLRGQRLRTERDLRFDGFAVGNQGSQFDLVAFERAEVVKGPSSMLYGQGSVGGFINLVRKRPQPEIAASVVAQAGSFDTYRGEVDVTGALDADKNVLGRVVAAYQDAGSFIDDIESDRLVVGPTLEAYVGDRTRVLVDVLHQADSFLPSNGIPLQQVGSDLLIPAISRTFLFGAASQEKSTATDTFVTVRLDHKIADRWLASLLLNQGRHKTIVTFDNYGYGLAANGDSGVYASHNRDDADNWAGELRLDGAFDLFGREHLVLLGLEKNSRKQRNRYGYAYVGRANVYANDFADAGAVPGSAIPFTSDLVSTSNNQAAYGQVVLGLLERTRLLVGARYDEADQRSLDNLAATRTQNDNSEPTFRIGLTQGITDNVTAYATYAQSFNPVDALARNNEILDPETGEGYEIGVKTEWFDGGLSATLAAFRQDLDNRPIDDPANGLGESFSISGGLQRSEGVELEVSGSPYPGVTLGLAAALLDTDFIDPLDPNFGLQTEGTVERQGSLYGSYEFQEGSWKGFGLGATVVAVGERTLLRFGGNQFVEGYERVDFHAYYTGLPGWDLSLQVRNVFDSTYVEHTRQQSFGNYFGAPRAVLFRAEVDF